VKVEFSGKLDPGISIAQIDVEPPELTITGPESLVLNPKNLVSDPFDLTGVVEDAERTLAVYTGQSGVRILDKPQVKVKIRVERNR
jgi:YbbR domain-containing protein